MKTYIIESYKELTQKVEWPSRSSLQSSAILVMVASFIISLIILAMDLSFQTIMGAIYSI